MTVAIQRIADRSMQDRIEQLEIEYFRWVNAALGAEFGIGLDAWRLRFRGRSSPSL